MHSHAKPLINNNTRVSIIVIMLNVVVNKVGYRTQRIDPTPPPSSYAYMRTRPPKMPRACMYPGIVSLSKACFRPVLEFFLKISLRQQFVWVGMSGMGVLLSQLQQKERMEW